MNNQLRDRLADLLATEATQALSEAETRELAELLAMYPDVDPDVFAHAAAAADLAFSGEPEPLPPHLAERIESQAMIRFGLQPMTESTYQPPPAPGFSRLSLLGWAFAAGLAAVLLWYVMPKPAKSLEQQVKELRELPDSKEFKGEKPEGSTSGEIVWNPGKQEGFLIVRGLPTLDPSREQYQLWIVDAGRTDPEHKEPIDAGVFDVRPDGTLVMPVKATLKVRDASAFAITKETAGGVVVAKGPHLLVLTPPKAG